MTVELRTLLSVVLAIPAFLLIAVALWSLIRADRMARSPEALRAIEEGEDLDNQYFPPDELLSDRGRHLRRRGMRMLTIAAGLFACALLTGLA